MCVGHAKHTVCVCALGTVRLSKDRWPKLGKRTELLGIAALIGDCISSFLLYIADVMSPSFLRPASKRKPAEFQGWILSLVLFVLESDMGSKGTRD